jgi:hypothetical protein
VFAAVQAVGCILEGLGYSVYARIVPLRVVGDLLGGAVRLAWRKVQLYVDEERRRTGSQKTFEWFQWLAAQLERYAPGKTNLEIGAPTKLMRIGSRNSCVPYGDRRTLGNVF